MRKFGIRIVMQLFLLTIVVVKNNVLAQTKPNIIFILTDDIGYEVPTCNGGKTYSTPNIDKLAKNGMRFTQCHTSPVCSPSRFSFLTGKYNFRNYIDWGKMNPDTKTVANMLKNAGYKTLVSGKWQLNGGDASIHKFGFDDYLVWKPYEFSTKYFQYKNPVLYENGADLPAGDTENKYGEDFFTQKIFNFIDSNKQNPFFIYYPMVLCHKGFSPTPDDSDFTSWDPAKKRQLKDTIYFKSMVKYMDKKIGQIVDRIKSLGLAENTLIVVTGDNGTPGGLTSVLEDGEEVKGGKNTTKEFGTHVPLVMYWKGKIGAGKVNDDLIDFTDFLPTFAKIAKTTIPTNLKPTDGVSFASALTSTNNNKRQWIYNYFKSYPYAKLVRWAQTATYKLYKTDSGYTFYNIVADFNEEHPMPDTLLQPAEVQIWQQLQAVIENFDRQSPPFLDSLTVAEITDTSAVIGARITDEGGVNSVITKGTFYSTSPELTLKNNILIDSSSAISFFSQNRKNLRPQTLYYGDAFATNSNGCGVGFAESKSFRTLSKSVVAQPTMFSAEAGYNSVHLTWNAATFPADGAKKAGYLVVSSIDTPQMKVLPNGLSPDTAILAGVKVLVADTLLPTMPEENVVQNDLLSNTTYHFLLVPYTWNGKDTSTFHYLLTGALTTTATTLAPDNPEITNIHHVFQAGELAITAEVLKRKQVTLPASERAVGKTNEPIVRLVKSITRLDCIETRKGTFRTGAIAR